MKIMDLHSHTYYSSCGKDEPEAIIEKAIESGIDIFGISDHNYGIGERKEEYRNKILSLKEQYRSKIKLLAGIEITARPDLYDKDDISGFDYCLIEHLDEDGSLAHLNPISFLSGFKIPTGIAHTNLFAYCEKTGREPEEFFKELAGCGIFWEMNVNYDSIHNYREHQYVYEFLNDPYKQEIIKKAGVRISVGFDGHRVEDYLPERVIGICKKLEELKVKSAEEILPI